MGAKNVHTFYSYRIPIEIIIYSYCNRLAQVHFICAFNVFGVHRYLSSFAYKYWHLFQRNVLHSYPLFAIVALPCKEIAPAAFGKVDLAAVFAIHHWCNQKIIAEIIFIIDMPASLVVGMMENKCLQSSVSTMAGNQAFLHNVRYQGVA